MPEERGENGRDSGQFRHSDDPFQSPATGVAAPPPPPVLLLEQRRTVAELRLLRLVGLVLGGDGDDGDVLALVREENLREERRDWGHA